MQRTFPGKTLLATLLCSLTVIAYAGGHAQSKPKEAISFDPALRSEVTGTVLVTGANRGIGLAMTKNYAERGWTVIATARKPKKADELNALAAANDRVTVERMDLLDHKGIDDLAKKLEGVPIDLLFNNAAILGDAADQDLGQYDYDELSTIMAVNVTGTLKMTEAFMPHVEASDMKKIVAMSSVQGSVGLLRDTSIPFYKMSKAAVNMGMSSVAKRVKKNGVTIAIISPGAVQTRMMDAALDHAGMRYRGFLITTEESAEAVINVADQYELKHTGRFMAHTGEELPW